MSDDSTNKRDRAIALLQQAITNPDWTHDLKSGLGKIALERLYTQKGRGAVEEFVRWAVHPINGFMLQPHLPQSAQEVFTTLLDDLKVHTQNVRLAQSEPSILMDAEFIREERTGAIQKVPEDIRREVDWIADDHVTFDESQVFAQPHKNFGRWGILKAPYNYTAPSVRNITLDSIKKDAFEAMESFLPLDDRRVGYDSPQSPHLH